MSKTKITILIKVDALRYDYITKDLAPFMHYFEYKAISGALVPTFGFEPDASYLASLYPEEADGGGHSSGMIRVAVRFPCLVAALSIEPEKMRSTGERICWE